MKLSVKNLSKHYDKPILQNVSFEMNTGILGLLGENGAGKTTLLEIISTLIAPHTGQVDYEGMDVVQDLHTIRKQIGYLPQKFDFFPHLTVQEILEYVCRLKNIHGRQRITEIEEKLNQVGLLEQRNKKFNALSGGMKQRLGIAQAIVGNPKLLLIDEPTVGLDPHERVSFRQLLTTLATDRSIIISTHIVEDVALTTDFVLVLHQGIVNYFGDIPAFIKSVEGKVWLYSGENVTEKLQKQGALIISTQVTASGVHIRYLSDTPLEGSLLLEPTLEHAYIYTNRKKV
ncbi:ATP-binding cassette domain-containing protein [Paenibacillus pabuli]|uniref:ATP-binding cassette domain-containing protein n=1 Tax=Paenibacillus pabuli TaxID=1472 RepID=UPI0007827252|nr:ATP-binding cassette domain-containing protein [Paenibacillus pabuli]MEC0123461.1 ATP-binding cassette domain-containing protein [Paenibacillus pabuli]